MFNLLSILQSATRIGLKISASFYYQLEPSATLHGPPLKVCAYLHQQFPASHIDLNAWYQLRYLKWCKWGWVVSNQYTTTRTSLYQFTLLYTTNLAL